MGNCIEWIGQLGGDHDQTRDCDSGVRVLWQGLQRLHDIAATWRLLRSGKASLTY
ncbi:MAG: hypothetical protein MUC48_26120 [Leptolyngbya sp. Prado105]|nr:hypothetical protein [Leptolyngbya sp. Prado105]